MAVSLVNVIGVVKDAETGEPIQGVTVEKLMGGQRSGVISNTDPAGNFNVPIISIDGLRFSHVGYQSEDYLSGQFVAGTNTIYLVKDYINLPGVTVTTGKGSWLWLLLLGGAIVYFNKKKRRRK